METIKKSLTKLQSNISNVSNVSNVSNNSKNSQISKNPFSRSVTQKKSAVSSTDDLFDMPINSLQNESIKTPPLSIKKSNILDKSSSMIPNFFDFKTVTIIILVILILAILGFNIFKFLGEGTDMISSFLSPIFGDVGKATGKTTKSTISGISDGTKKIIDSTSNTLDTAIGSIQSGTISGVNVLEDSLKKNKNIVDTENDNEMTEKRNFNKEDEPEPVRSRNQQGGYCYIGKINDTRHCAKVSNKSFCMSGHIYPTKDLCVNPKVRH